MVLVKNRHSLWNSHTPFQWFYPAHTAEYNCSPTLFKHNRIHLLSLVYRNPFLVSLWLGSCSSSEIIGISEIYYLWTVYRSYFRQQTEGYALPLQRSYLRFMVTRDVFAAIDRNCIIVHNYTVSETLLSAMLLAYICWTKKETSDLNI